MRFALAFVIACHGGAAPVADEPPRATDPCVIENVLRVWTDGRTLRDCGESVLDEPEWWLKLCSVRERAVDHRPFVAMWHGDRRDRRVAWAFAGRQTQAGWQLLHVESDREQTTVSSCSRVGLVECTSHDVGCLKCIDSELLETCRMIKM